jgi:FKBP-type peptidyl-prolyl isomerase-like protein
LNRVIKCWTEALPLMKVGGKSRLICPADLAYGDQGWSPLIKPGAPLVFEVDLLDIIPQSAQSAPPAPPAEHGSSWYYCADFKAYWPDVKECPGGWQKVVPQPTPSGR